jgi:hypothetical protein
VNGSHLFVAECADFCHIYDAHFQRKQTIDFFGEICGVALTPDGGSLYIGNSDEAYGCILQYDFLDGSEQFVGSL